MSEEEALIRRAQAALALPGSVHSEAFLQRRLNVTYAVAQTLLRIVEQREQANG